MSVAITPFFGLNRIESSKSLIAQNWGSKSIRIGLAMTTLARVQMPFLVSTILICQQKQKELGMDEGSACSCYHPMWKPASCMMATNMS